MSETSQSPTGQDNRQNGGGTPGSGASSSGWLNKTDVVVAVVILAVCLLAWHHSSLWLAPSAAFTSVVPPTWFPRLVLGCVIVLAFFLPIEQHLKGEAGAELDDDRRIPIKPITYITTVVTVSIAASMEWLGTIVTVVLICIVLPLLWGERRWVILIPFVILFPLAVLFMFKGLFSVNFEAGVIGLGIK